MAYGVDRYPNPPEDFECVRVYYELEDGILFRYVERDDEEEDDGGSERE